MLVAELRSVCLSVDIVFGDRDESILRRNCFDERNPVSEIDIV